MTKKLKYSDVLFLIQQEFPNFEISSASIDLPYIIAWDFSRYLLDCYRRKKLSDLDDGLNFIESLYSYNNSSIDELATIWFLEWIQNVWWNNNVNPEVIYDRLWEKSKKEWNNLNTFWKNLEEAKKLSLKLKKK